MVGSGPTAPCATAVSHPVPLPARLPRRPPQGALRPRGRHHHAPRPMARTDGSARSPTPTGSPPPKEPEPIIEAQRAHLHARLAEIDKAAANLISAIENGTDPAIVKPRINQTPLRTRSRSDDSRDCRSLPAASRTSRHQDPDGAVSPQARIGRHDPPILGRSVTCPVRPRDECGTNGPADSPLRREGGV